MQYIDIISINVTMICQINERLIKSSGDLCWWAWHKPGATTCARCYKYRYILTQLGMLPCKLDVIITITILFSISNIPPTGLPCLPELGNILEFDNYFQGPGNTLEFKKKHGTLIIV